MAGSGAELRRDVIQGLATAEEERDAALSEAARLRQALAVAETDASVALDESDRLTAALDEQEQSTAQPERDLEQGSRKMGTLKQQLRESSQPRLEEDERLELEDGRRGEIKA